MDKYHLLRRSGILGLIEISLPLLVQKRFGRQKLDTNNICMAILY